MWKEPKNVPTRCSKPKCTAEALSGCLQQKVSERSKVSYIEDHLPFSLLCLIGGDIVDIDDILFTWGL